jgi:hypothetical protein
MKIQIDTQKQSQQLKNQLDSQSQKQLKQWKQSQQQELMPMKQHK